MHQRSCAFMVDGMPCDLRLYVCVFFFFSSRRRHTRSDRDWSSDVCSSDLENRDPPFVGGRGDNQFFRHENSLCVTPAWPESPFCAAPAWPGLTGRIAASFCPSEFPKIGAAPGNAGTHVGHTCREVAWRSKPEGLAALRPLSEKTFLSLSRLVRRRKRAGRSADDAVLTLKSFLLVTPAEPGSAIPNANSIPVHSGEAEMSHGTGGLVS